MSEIKTKYIIKIEVLSPVSIGAGAEKDWVNGVDFLIKDRRLYRLNLHKLLAERIDPTLYMMRRDSEGLSRVIGNKIESVSDCSMRVPENTDNNVKSFVRNELSGKPIVPGSSLKGAMRSHILTALNSQGDESSLGDFSKGENLMRFFHVSDFEFEDTSLVNTKVFNLRKDDGMWYGGWKHDMHKTTSEFRPTGFNVIYESLVPGQVAFGSIAVASGMFARTIEESEKGSIKDEKKAMLSIETLFSNINCQTSRYLEKEKEFFTTYAADHSDVIVSFIDELQRKLPNSNNSCILKMSAGAGFHSITGDWLFEDFTKGEMGRKGQYDTIKDNLPKSRKIAVCESGLYLMGFVRLSVVTDEYVKAYKEEQLKKQEQQRRMEELEKERQKNYDKLIRDAEDADNPHDALAKALEAGKLYPDGTKHRSIIEKNKEKIRQEEYECRKKEAFNKLNRNEFDDAKQLLVQLLEYGCEVDVIQRQIRYCENAVKESTFKDYMADCPLVLKDPDAYANYLAKWKGGYELSEIITVLQKILAQKEKSARKVWTNEKKWNKMSGVIGEAMCKELLNSIK